MDPSAVRFLELSRFWVQRVLVPILVLIGAGGNIVTVMVLTRRRMRCSTNIYLTALAVTDLIYLFFVLILSFEHYPNINDIRYELYWRFYGINHWFTDAASSTSIWLTVSFTVERYIAVCHPIRGKVLCTEKRAKRVIAAVSIICILATASTSFEYQLTTTKQCVQRTCGIAAEIEPAQPVRDIEEIENTSVLENSTISNNLTNVDNSVNDTGQERSEVGLAVPSYADWEELVLTWNESEFGIEKEDMIEQKFVSPFNVLLKDTIEDTFQESTSSCEETLDSGQNCTGLNSTCDQQNVTRANSSSCVNGTSRSLEDDISECCIERVIIRTEPTRLGQNATYKTVFYWFSSVTFAFLPLILLATFNCFLVNSVRKSQKERKRMTKSQENSSQNQEYRITVILISVVILFLICQTPTACLLIYTSVYQLSDYSEYIVRGLGNVFNLLVAINAACNFLLYCVLSDKYRRTFKALFCDKKLSRKDTFAISATFTTRVASHHNGAGCKRNASAYLPRTVEPTH